MQGEHWLLIGNSCWKLCFAGSLGREKYSFPKQPQILEHFWKHEKNSSYTIFHYVRKMRCVFQMKYVFPENWSQHKKIFLTVEVRKCYIKLRLLEAPSINVC